MMLEEYIVENEIDDRAISRLRNEPLNENTRINRIEICRYIDTVIPVSVHTCARPGWMAMSVFTITSDIDVQTTLGSISRALIQSHNQARERLEASPSSPKLFSTKSGLCLFTA